MSNNPYDAALDAAYNTVETAQPVTSRIPRLVVGKHRVLLSYYGGRASQHNLGINRDAEYVGTSSTVQMAGEKRRWDCLPQQSGWADAYEADRINKSSAAVDRTAGIANRPPRETGAAMARGELR